MVSRAVASPDEAAMSGKISFVSCKDSRYMEAASTLTLGNAYTKLLKLAVDEATIADDVCTSSTKA